jgi:spore maturation protein CgeB
VRVLVCGDFAFEFYEPDFCWALREAGAQVIELPVSRYFAPLRAAQEKLSLGPGLALAGAALVAACAREKPDAVLLWRTPWARPLTLWLARAAGARQIALYNNDDPFGPDRDRRIWRAYRRLIPHADLCLAYREVNLADYRAAGARRVALLRSGFHPLRHRPLALAPTADVVFVGHCEDDGRLDAVDALAQSGLQVRIFGTGWERFLRGRPGARYLPIQAALGESYVRVIASAKIALAFLSRRNRDEYTRRCFEIPAIGTLMLAPRTPTLLQLFREDAEAAFFSSPAELVAQAQRYCKDEPLRARVAAAGRARVLEGGHDLVSRARELLRELAA